jgi:outer membrane protein OmpA-like peptidoglycan-associated protein
MDGFEDENGCPEADNDGDGVVDADDECPSEAEDTDGFEDGNGCPDLDDDHDGAPDEHDECRMEPEDADGFEDGNGCPDPDNDRDGVLDAQDRCPVVAGVAALEGCPESDRDSDTVPDHTDNCPDEAGTVENHGCREQQLVQISGEQISLVENVYFRSGRNTIEARSFPLLDNVARVITSHPEITRVRVEGHTDSRGNRNRNVRLSQSRAQAVVRYLVAHGVSASRLEANGYGPDRPLVSPEQTAEDQARNRRVEFHIEAAPETTTPPAP